MSEASNQKGDNRSDNLLKNDKMKSDSKVKKNENCKNSDYSNQDDKKKKEKLAYTFTKKKRRPTESKTAKFNDGDEDLSLFLDAEREAQEAYLTKPLRLDNNEECPHKKNLMNVLNNEIINKQVESEK